MRSRTSCRASRASCARSASGSATPSRGARCWRSIESNESLQPYEVRSRIAGTVIAKDVAPGEFVATDGDLLDVADLDTVWVDLDVYRRDFGKLRVGQPVRSTPATAGRPSRPRLATSRRSAR